MPTIDIHPETLKWALRRAGLSIEALARAAGVRPERAQDWLDGNKKPTYEQTKKIARRLHVPFGQLLLPPPERIDLPIRDFRRGPAALGEPSPELLEVVYDALRKRNWWRERQGRHYLPFVGRFRGKTASPEVIADDIRRAIPIDALQREARSREDFLSKLSKHAEELGILVLRRGIVADNPHRPLDPNEFSGFAIADRVAPIIMINMRDYPSRRNFTFAHELAHLWLGETALDDNLELDAHEELERLCDQVAAELLIPRRTLMKLWHENVQEAVEDVAEYCRVSVWAAARRARDLKLISDNQYRAVVEQYYGTLEDRERRRKSEGGNFYKNVEVRNSRLFTTEVVAAVREGEITIKEGADLLWMRISSFATYLRGRS